MGLNTGASYKETGSLRKKIEIVTDKVISRLFPMFSKFTSEETEKLDSNLGKLEIEFESLLIELSGKKNNSEESSEKVFVIKRVESLVKDLK